MKLIRGDRVVHVDEPARIGRVEGVFGAYIVVVRWPAQFSYEYLHDLRKVGEA